MLQTLPWGVVVLDGYGTVLRINQQAAHWWGAPPQDLQGKQLGQLATGTLPPNLLQALQQVAGDPAQSSGEFFLPQHKQWITMSSARQGNNWVVYWQDITAQKQHQSEREQATQELLRVKDELAQRVTDSYLALYNSMDEGFCIVEVLFDAAQHPVDYRFLDVNPAFEVQSGLRDVLGKTMRELAPAHEQYWFDNYGRVAHTGEPTRFEAHSQVLGRWFDVNAFPIGPPQYRHVAVLFTDSTERKRTEDALRESDANLRQAVGLAHLGICHWDCRQDLMQGNDERFLMLGLDPAQEVLPVAQARALTHPDDRPVWASIREQVEALGKFQATYRIVRHDNGAVRWLSEVGRVVEWHGKTPLRVSSVLLDVTTDYEAAEALRRSEEQFRLLVTATFDTVYRISADYTQVERFVGNDYPVNTLRPVQAWFEEFLIPEDLPGIRVALVEFIGQKKPFEMEHRIRQADGTIGWVHSRTIPVLDARGELTGWLGAATDVSARKQQEQQQAFLLRFSDALRAETSATSVAYRALGMLGEQLQLDRCYIGIYDLAGDRGIFPHQVGNHRVPPLPAEVRLSDFPDALRVASDLTLRIDDLAQTEGLSETDRQNLGALGLRALVAATLRRVGTGPQWAIVALSADVRHWTPGEVTLLEEATERTWAAMERVRAEAALQEAHAQLVSVLEGTSDAFYDLDADLRFTYVNGQAARLWCREPSALLGQPLWQAFPQVVGSEPYRLHAEVQQTGQPAHFETLSPVLGTWIDASIYPGRRGGLSVFFRDITARKQAEEELRLAEERHRQELEQQVSRRTQQLQDSRHLLQTVFDASPTAIVVMRILSDAAGRPEDFEILIYNEFNKQVVGRDDLAGQRFTAMFPQTVPTGVLARLLEVATTGEPADFEKWYVGEGMQHWFRHIVVRQDSLLVLTSEVITPRKLLEQAQAESFALLQQSEAVAAMGSWDYDLNTQELIWSDGLYHLFDLPVGSAVKLQTFLDAMVDDDRPAAARLLRTLTAGSGSFDASLRLRVGDAVKTVRFKAVPLPDAPGAPERVLGVCLDVSDVQRLEAENLALKLDRHKELLLAILQAQEDERQRLGEVLHNGLGQILYATKLHLDQLDTPALHAQPGLATLHQQTGRLLADAMQQTRTLAHELVPTSLAEFGLTVAVRDICRDLSTPQLLIECHVWGEEVAVPPPVQATLFRLAQELAHNIVRHAGATHALLELETLPGGVSLRAEDNGHGFDPGSVAEGLGLRTVRQAVALLGGTVAVDSSPDFGTHIRLRIPLPLFSKP